MEWCEFKPFDNGDTLSTWKLTDHVIQNRIMNQIRSWWNVCNRSHYFPGAQPVSIERKDLSKLFSKDYWVCVKSDGIRFLLVFVCLDNKNMCLLVNRKHDMYLIRARLCKSAFAKGTVFDGELVCDNVTGRLEYLIYDSTIVCGNSMVKLPHSQRMEHALSLVDFMHNTSITIHIKQFYPIRDMREYINIVIPTITHGIDGYIFTPEHHPVCSGTHFTMFKWKERYENTVDFQVSKNLKELRVSKGNTVIIPDKNARLIVPNKVLEKEIRRLAPCIVECKWNEGNLWTAVLIRKDKTHPNNYLTYSKTLLNIEEDIQVGEFLIKEETKYKLF